MPPKHYNSCALCDVALETLTPPLDHVIARVFSLNDPTQSHPLTLATRKTNTFTVGTYCVCYKCIINVRNEEGVADDGR